MSIIEILEGKRAWYESNGHAREAQEAQDQIMAMRQAWVKAMHRGMAKESAS